MSSSFAKDCGMRVGVKLLQFFVSVYLVFALYKIGPHWILLVACLAIPIYGIYLLLKSPERSLKHPLPYIRYKAIIRAKSWLRVDLTICITMAVVCFSFALVLFIGFFVESHTANMFLLQAAAAALLLGILYLFNIFLTLRQLQSGTIDFPHNGPQPMGTTSMGYIAQTSGTRPLAVDTSSPRQTATNQAFPQEQPSTATIRAQESSWSSPTEFPSSDFAPGSHFVTSPIPVVYQPFEADESAVRGLSRQQQSPTKETTWKREFREFTKKEWLEEDNASFSNGKYQPQQVKDRIIDIKTNELREKSGKGTERGVDVEIESGVDYSIISRSSMAPQPTDMPSSFEAQNKRPKWQSANSGPLKDPPRTRPDEGERMMSKSMKVQGPKQLSTKLSSISQPQKGHRDEADARVVQSVILDPYDETPITDSRPKDSNYSTSTPSSSTVIKKGQHVTPSFGQESQQTSSLSRKTRWQLRPSPVKVNPVDTKEFSTKEFSKSLTTKEMTTTSNLPRNQHNCYHQEGVQGQNNLAQKNEETSNQMQYYRKIPVKTLMAPSKPPAHV